MWVRAQCVRLRCICGMFELYQSRCDIVIVVLECDGFGACDAQLLALFGFAIVR
jgi:hypothetical protein